MLELKDDGNYIIDTATENDKYEGVLDGGVAIYEVDDEGITDEVWADQAGEYDNFGQVYDELDQLAAN